MFIQTGAKLLQTEVSAQTRGIGLDTVYPGLQKYFTTEPSVVPFINCTPPLSGDGRAPQSVGREPATYIVESPHRNTVN